MKELTMVKTRVLGDQQRIRKRNNSDMFAEKESNVPFPNTQYGRKNKSR